MVVRYGVRPLPLFEVTVCVDVETSGQRPGQVRLGAASASGWKSLSGGAKRQ